MTHFEQINLTDRNTSLDVANSTKEQAMHSQVVVEDSDKSITFLQKKVKGISGSTIKIIAIVTMLIDHIAAVLLLPLWQNTYMEQYNNNIVDAYGAPLISHSFIFKLYEIMRSIGRIGFPIFCFLLVEGFIHTRSRLKYMFRLGLFALISEIPFNLAFSNTLFYKYYQNVFFTLFLGFSVLMIVDKLLKCKKLHVVLRYVICIPVIYLGMKAANLLFTDYGGFGVLTIVVMYLLRSSKPAQMYGGCMVLTLENLGEAYAFLGLIPIALYNGKRGLKLKYVFYLFYPCHLLILYGLAKLFHLA